MKYLRYFESGPSDLEVVNKLMNRRKSYDINSDYRIEIARPKAGMFGKGDVDGQSYIYIYKLYNI